MSKHRKKLSQRRKSSRRRSRSLVVRRRRNNRRRRSSFRSSSHTPSRPPPALAYRGGRKRNSVLRALALGSCISTNQHLVPTPYRFPGPQVLPAERFFPTPHFFPAPSVPWTSFVNVTNLASPPLFQLRGAIDNLLAFADAAHAAPAIAFVRAHTHLLDRVRTDPAPSLDDLVALRTFLRDLRHQHTSDWCAADLANHALNVDAMCQNYERHAHAQARRGGERARWCADGSFTTQRPCRSGTRRHGPTPTDRCLEGI